MTEFKIAVLTNNNIQENSKRQFNKLRNKINEQKEYFIKEIKIVYIKKANRPWLVWLSCWALSHKPKSHGFDSQSGHMSGLRVQSLVGVCSGGNTSMFLSHTDVSLPLSFPSPLSKINKHVLR